MIGARSGSTNGRRREDWEFAPCPPAVSGGAGTGQKCDSAVVVVGGRSRRPPGFDRERKMLRELGVNFSNEARLRWFGMPRRAGSVQRLGAAMLGRSRNLSQITYTPEPDGLTGLKRKKL